MTRRIHILARWKWISAVVIIIVLGTFTLASIKLDYRFGSQEKKHPISALIEIIGWTVGITECL